jgi:LmbE family N-acetylglucosaminyl deacetylase
MKKTSSLVLRFLFLVFFLAFAKTGLAQDETLLSEFSPTDRILVLAPHPDDEAIGAGGVLQKALKAGAATKVVCFTNGDANELAFIVYEKRLTFFKKEFLHMGEVRRKETTAALQSIGIGPKDIIFLGYPDFGTLDILMRYWAGKPYKSIFTRVSKVAYPDAMSVNAPYTGESILRDLKTILSEFRPTKIFVSNPVDTNRDHRALYLFLKIALWDLGESLKAPEIFPYLIHVAGWPKPRGYHPTFALTSPSKYTGMIWQRLDLSEKEVAKKHEMTKFYKSQIEYNPRFLLHFVRKNELFGDYPPMVLKRQKGLAEIGWQDINLGKEDMEEVLKEDEEHGYAPQGSKSDISALAYAYRDSDLWIRITLKGKVAKHHGIFVHLLGYSKGKDFALMPKIHISIGVFMTRVADKARSINVKDFKIFHRGREITIKIPLIALGNPQRILSSARAAAFPYEATAWRVLELE